MVKAQIILSSKWSNC